jgi:hypothetical protein
MPMRVPKWWWRVLTLAHRAALADQTRAAAFGGRGGGVHDTVFLHIHIFRKGYVHGITGDKGRTSLGTPHESQPLLVVGVHA